MRRPARAPARTLVVLLAVGMLPLAVLVAEPSLAEPSAADELDDARRELDGATRELEALRGEMRRVDAEVVALDRELLAASTRLEQLREELADAREAHRTAAAELERATEELRAADDELTGALDGWRSDRDRLAARARHLYVHGGSSAPELMVGGIGGAEDWHEVVVTLAMVGRLVDDDAALVERGARDTRTIASLRVAVAGSRRDAAQATRTAAEHERHVTELEEEQAATLESLERARSERQAVLAELSEDAEARAALVAVLEERVADLELDASSVLIPVEVDLDPYGPPPGWADGLSDDGRRWAAAIAATATRHGVDPRLLAAVVWTESGFRADAVSSKGALGLAQLMPGTARRLGVDARDPLDNLDGGADYLRTQLDAFGRVDLALAAYNAGPGRVEGRVPDIVETQLYVRRVLERYARLRG
ncbi:MAG: transglycosylase SLT domain-containing protein [Actinomycetota bacterium]